MKPTPADIRAARLAAKLTLAQAAKLAGLGAGPRWAEYENGKRGMPDLRWAHFKRKISRRKRRP